jgi:hypothetical protein
MSLLDDTRDTVIVKPEIETEDSQGNPVRVPDPDPENWLTLHGRVQPSSSTEDVRDGQRVGTYFRFITRDFVAGAFAEATVTSPSRGWVNRAFDVDGEPLPHDGSDITRHYTVALKARTAKAVA